jgi:hypothetical protein
METTQMNARKTIMMTLLGTAGLALAASGAYAQTGTRTCNQATITHIGAGYHFPSESPTGSAGIFRHITMDCTNPGAGWSTTQTKYFLYPSIDSDATLAIALTAKVEGNAIKVRTHPYGNTHAIINIEVLP